jgi:hypothetical protein
MIYPYATASISTTTNQETYICHHGATLGRGFGCQIQLHDPAISELHALFSARGGKLILVALRGPLRFQNRTVWDLELAEDQQIELAEGIRLMIHEVYVPREVLAVSIGGGKPEAIPWGDSSLVGDNLSLAPGRQPDAHAVFMQFGHVVKVLRGESEEFVEVGTTWEIGGQEVRVVLLEIEQLNQGKTRGRRGIRTWIRPISADAAEVRDELGHTGKLTGNSAELLYVIHALLQAGKGPILKQEEVLAGLFGSKAEKNRTNFINNVVRRFDLALAEQGLRSDVLTRKRGDLWLADNVELEAVPGP